MFRHGTHRWLMAAVLSVGVSQSADADHASMGFGDGTAGPISTMGAATLPKGQVAVSLRKEFIDFDRFSGAELAAFGAQGIAADSTDTLLGTTLSVAYGVTDDFSVTVRMPYLVRDAIREPENENGVIEVEHEGDAEGVGDLMLMGQYRFWQSPAHELELAVVGGVKIPTGDHNDRTREGTRFEVEHQPGTGSWDPVAGLAATKRRGRFSLHGNVLYTITTEGAQDTELGDLFNFNAAAVYHLGGDERPVRHHDHGAEPPAPHAHAPRAASAPTVDAMLELNGEWQEKHEVDGRRDPNSGGTILFLSPGARVHLSPRWSLFGSFGVPIWQDVNGKNHEVDYRISGGTTVAF